MPSNGHSPTRSIGSPQIGSPHTPRRSGSGDSVGQEGRSPSISSSRASHYYPDEDTVNHTHEIRNVLEDAASFISHSSTLRTMVSKTPYGINHRYKERDSLGYIDEKGHSQLRPPSMYASSSIHKSLPSLPANMLDDEDEYHSRGSFHTRLELATALGEDNAPHTTEIETIPCAGIRIAHGRLKGLVAWRLVVKIGGKEAWFPKKEHFPDLVSMVTPPTPIAEEWGYLDKDIHGRHKSASMSSSRKSSTSSDEPDEKFYETPHAYKHLSMSNLHGYLHHPQHNHHHQSMSPPHASSSSSPSQYPTAVTTNFILDTSRHPSSIPRETLLALGFKPSTLHSGKPVLLRVQGIDARFTIARDGEAGRLGVQFMEDAGVSFYIDREVGPVLYAETGRGMRDVPRTVKMNLQQKVRSIFGIVTGKS